MSRRDALEADLLHLPVKRMRDQASFRAACVLFQFVSTSAHSIASRSSGAAGYACAQPFGERLERDHAQSIDQNSVDDVLSSRMLPGPSY